MPTTKKKISPSRHPAPPTTTIGTRADRIRRAHEDQAAVPDARDVAADIVPPPSIDVSRAPEAGQALELRATAGTLVVKDRASHEYALEFVRGAKQLQRKITEHWQRITRSVDDLKRTMLNLKATDLAPVEEAIRLVERAALDYENDERQRQAAADEANRLERERQAKAERQRELDAAEDRALELEQQSTNLSARELWFVESVFNNDIDAANPSLADIRKMQAICKEAGYKDVDNSVARLLRMPKITEAIRAKHDARAIREQADAKRQQPIDIIDAPPVESNLARGRGLPTTRTYYSCEVLDAGKLREAFLNGELNPEALIPNEVYLNAQARAAKSAEIFERAFPGCRLVKRQGLAG